MDSLEREFYDLMSSHKRAMKIKDCFHHKKEECKGKIKQAHSIQRNGRLSIIEADIKGNKSIYSFSNPKISDRSPMEDLIPLGKKEASTFFGFCDYHDTTLFSPVENFPFDNSSKHCFLHSYRSFAHSYHRKREELKGYSDPNSELVKKAHHLFETMQIGAKVGLDELEPYKKRLDQMIENEIYDDLEYFVFEKEGLFPFAVSSLMSPDVTYSGKSMNNHIDFSIPFSQPMISFLPDKTSTFVILAAFPDDHKSIVLFDELNELNDLQLEKAITSLIIANCENTFFSPLFWNSLSSKEKRSFLDEFIANTLLETYRNKFFISRFNFFSNRFEMKTLLE